MHFSVRPVLLAGIVVFGLLVGGCTSMSTTPAAPAPPQFTPETGKLTAADVRARPAPLEGGTGAAYMIVLNGLDVPVRLASVSGDVATAIELHETINEDGVMKMMPQPDGFEIPAGGSIELKPGGKHVMMIGLVSPLEVGQEFPLTLNFDNGESLALNVPVMSMDMTMPMDDGAMDHGAMEGSMNDAMESMTPEPEMEMDEGAMDHGAMDDVHSAEMQGDEHEIMMVEVAPEIIAAVEALPIDDLHNMDDELSLGTVDPEYLTAIAMLREGLAATNWPESLMETTTQLDETLAQLQQLLEAGDAAAADPISLQAHDLAHKLEMLVGIQH